METPDTTQPGIPGERARIVEGQGKSTVTEPAKGIGAAKTTAPPSVAEDPLEGVSGLRDTIFDRLVSDENDVVGLLAYSLSMQNKRDWLAAFQTERGRDPNAAEMAAYDIGERIERRLATYRKLAEHALSGNSFWASAALTPVSELPGPPATGTYAASSPTPAPSSPNSSHAEPRRSGPFGDVGGKLALAGGVFVILVVAAFAARHMIGV
jgi:hypothetical protein